MRIDSVRILVTQPDGDAGVRAGGTFIFWVADWFALMNDKMGGDLDKIKVPRRVREEQ